MGKAGKDLKPQSGADFGHRGCCGTAGLGTSRPDLLERQTGARVIILNTAGEIVRTPHADASQRKSGCGQADGMQIAAPVRVWTVTSAADGTWTQAGNEDGTDRARDDVDDER